MFIIGAVAQVGHRNANPGDVGPSRRARRRRYWTEAMADSAEAAGHTDNLIEVARASRPWVRTQIELLRQWAAILRGERQGRRYDNLLTGAGVRRIAASDLRAIAKDLEAWIEHDRIAVIDISAERQYLEGPLPPFPGTARRGTQEPPPEEYANLSPDTTISTQPRSSVKPGTPRLAS